MGYSTSQRLYDENESTIHLLLRNLESGKATTFPIPPGAEVGSIEYHFHRILKCAEHYGPSPRIQALRKTLQVTYDASRKAVVLQPKRASSPYASALEPERLSLGSALAALDEYPGTMTMLEFSPSPDFSEDSLATQLAARGWELHRSTRREDERGYLNYAVERTPSPRQSPFEMLSDPEDGSGGEG